MDKMNSEITGFDYPDLNLSDDESQNQDNDVVPSGDPSKKTKINESIQKNNQVQTKINQSEKEQRDLNAPSKPQLPFFPPPQIGYPTKSSNVWMPPPPIAQKNTALHQRQHQNHQSNFDRSHQHSKNQLGGRDNRDVNKQRKNTVYVKNLPKSYSTEDKLMTFFKNEGVIKQIKVNEADQSAIIKFLKEENAFKFLKSNKIIFNRSYIVYGETQNIAVSQQQIADRLNDELGNVKKAEKTNLNVLKQKVNNQLSQNIRALYFLQNTLLDEDQSSQKEIKELLQKEVNCKIEQKKLLESENSDDYFRNSKFCTEDYDWSLNFTRRINASIDRKSLFCQFLKYGPIISIDYECISESKTLPNKESDQSQKSYFDYKIKRMESLYREVEGKRFDSPREINSEILSIGKTSMSDKYINRKQFNLEKFIKLNFRQAQPAMNQDQSKPSKAPNQTFLIKVGNKVKTQNQDQKIKGQNKL